MIPGSISYLIPQMFTETYFTERSLVIDKGKLNPPPWLKLLWLKLEKACKELTIVWSTDGMGRWDAA